MAKELAEIVATLKTLRTAQNLSQKRLAELSGVSFRSIQNVESGLSDLGASSLIALADTLNVSLDELLRGKRTVARENKNDLLAAFLEEALKLDYDGLSVILDAIRVRSKIIKATESVRLLKDHK